MLRKVLVLFAGVAVLSVAATAADEKPTIKEIMKKGHAGPKSILSGLKTQVKAGKWEDATSGANTLKSFGEALAEQTPSKGDAESWKKHAATYKTNTAAVADAVGKKDATASAAALGKIGMSCAGCHKEHKGK